MRFLTYRTTELEVLYQEKASDSGSLFVPYCLGRITSSLRISDRIYQHDLLCQQASSYLCRMGVKC